MAFLLRRGVFYVITVWAACTLNFLIPRLMPGNPVQAALSRFGSQLSPRSEHALAIDFGLNVKSSLLQQYASYWGQILHGNFGLSFTYFPTPVSTVIGQSLPWTVVLVGLSTVIAWCAGTLIGVTAGWRRGSWWDALIPTGAFFRGIPTFWIGMLLITVVGVKFRLFPVSGGYSFSVTPNWDWAFISSAIRHAILPAITIVIGSMAGHMLTMRNMMVTTLAEDYVLTAQAKGLSRKRVMLAYCARNAVLPSVVGFSLELGFVVSGALLVERLFSYPGVGFVMFQAIGNEDFPLMQAILLVITLAVLLANAVADIVFVVVDPRTRQVSR